MAQTLNVTRAAERLHLSQQAVSASLREFERELGVDLFERRGRRLSITAAGESLLADAAPLLASASAVARRTRDAEGSRSRTLRIGRSPAVSGDEAHQLTSVLSGVKTIAVQVEQLFPSQMLDGLLSGDLDIALGRVPVYHARVSAAVVSRQRLSIAVATENELADRTELSLADLAGQSLVLWSNPESSRYASFLLSLCNGAGIEPKVTILAEQGLPPVTAVIGTTDTFAFVTDMPVREVERSYVVVPLTPPAWGSVHASWLEGMPGNLVEEVVQSWISGTYTE